MQRSRPLEIPPTWLPWPSIWNAELPQCQRDEGKRYQGKKKSEVIRHLICLLSWLHGPHVQHLSSQLLWAWPIACSLFVRRSVLDMAARTMNDLEFNWFNHLCISQLLNWDSLFSQVKLLFVILASNIIIIHSYCSWYCIYVHINVSYLLICWWKRGVFIVILKSSAASAALSSWSSSLPADEGALSLAWASVASSDVCQLCLMIVFPCVCN